MKRIILIISILAICSTTAFADALILPEIVIKDIDLKPRCEKIMEKIKVLETENVVLEKNSESLIDIANYIKNISRLIAYYDSLVIFGCVDDPEN